MERQYRDMTVDELTDHALKFSSRISETDAVVEMAHRIHALQPQLEAVRRERDAALRRAKAEGAREMIKIVNDNKADQRVADNLDNTLSFDSFNEVLDTITCEIDARAAQIEAGDDL